MQTLEAVYPAHTVNGRPSRRRQLYITPKVRKPTEAEQLMMSPCFTTSSLFEQNIVQSRRGWPKRRRAEGSQP